MARLGNRQSDDPGHIADHNEMAARMANSSDFDNIQAAIDATSSSGGGTVLVPPGEYSLTNLVVPTDVNLIGSGSRHTVFRFTGSGPSITSSGQWLRQYIKGFRIEHNFNSNANVDMIAPIHSVDHCHFEDIRFVAKGGVTRHGFRMDAKQTGGTLNNTYYNQLINLDFATEDTQADGCAIFFNGDPELGVGANIIQGGIITGWKTGLYILGAGNLINCVQWQPCDLAGVRIIDARISTPPNVFNGCWWDDGASWADHIFILENDLASVPTPYSTLSMAIFVGGHGIDKAADVITTGTHPELIRFSYYG
jgi:hypothetical protein